MESHGAALKEFLAAYGRQGLFVCGLDREEHPYDVEDYVRHFGVRFPIFVDLNEDSSRDCCAGLDSVVVLDANHRRVRPGRTILRTRCKLGRCWRSSLATRLRSWKARRPQHSPRRCGHSPLSPHIAQPGWSEPVQLGLGRYPRVAAYGTNGGLCVWVTGEVPAQRIPSRCSTGRTCRRRGPFRRGKMPTPRRWMWALKPSRHGLGAKGGHELPSLLQHACGLRVDPPVAISPAGNDAFRPDIYCTVGGETVVAWYGWKIVQLRDYPNSWWRSIYVTTLAGGVPGPIRELAKMERGSDDSWDPVITGAAGELQVSWLRDENPPLLFSSARRAGGWSAQEELLPIQRDRQTFCSVRAASPVKKPGSRDGLVFELNLERETFLPCALELTSMRSGAAPRAGRSRFLSPRAPAATWHPSP